MLGSGKELRKVERAADKVALSRSALSDSIRGAHAAGVSLRDIANAAGVSHETVRRVIQSRP